MLLFVVKFDLSYTIKSSSLALVLARGNRAGYDSPKEFGCL